MSDASHGATYLQQEVRGIVDAHHQTSYSHHVVDIRKTDETDCSHVMDEHDEEVLRGKGQRYILFMQYIVFGLVAFHIIIVQILPQLVVLSTTSNGTVYLQVKIMVNDSSGWHRMCIGTQIKGF